jgi:hypothetical protein
MNFLRTLISVILLSVFLSACPANRKPLENYTGQPIPAGLSTEQIVQAIALGGARHGWFIEQTAPGELIGTVHVRQHMAKVKITHSDSVYSITYLDSTNMGYTESRIHRNYNKWIMLLRQSISQQFAIAKASTPKQ